MDFSNTSEQEKYIQTLLFDKENLKYELEKAKQEVKFLETNKKNDDDFFKQVRDVILINTNSKYLNLYLLYNFHCHLLSYISLIFTL